MKKGLLRCVSTGDVVETSYSPSAARATGKARAGYVPVEVGAEGEQTERFFVPAELLGRPPVAELLRRAAQEYGYQRRGPLRIPCPAAAFRRLLAALAGGHDRALSRTPYFDR